MPEQVNISSTLANMKFYFPPKNQNYTFLQTNRSDDLGSLWSTMNIDLQSNLGVIRVAPRLKLNTATADAANLGCPVGFTRFGAYLFTVAGTRVFKVTGNLVNPVNAPFVEDASTSAQTDYTSDYSDLTIFNQILFASTTDAIYSLSQATGGTWSSRDTLTSSTPHMMCYFQKFERLYTLDNNTTVRSMNTSYTVAVPGTDDYALSLSTGHSANDLLLTCIRASSNDIWIGAIRRSAEQPVGTVFQWDGISQQVTQTYKLKNAMGAMAICIMDDIPYVMDSNGCLQQYVGYGFKEVGRLPFTTPLPINVAASQANRFIHPNGMIPTKNGTILCFINNLNNDNGATINENNISGVYEWSPEFGFTHKYSLSYNPAASGTITDFGQNRISRVGGMADMNWSSTDSDRNGTMLLGATYYTDASTTTNGIFLDDSNNTIQKKGYFVTTWFNADEVQDKWIRLWSVYRRLLQSTDNIVFKYRLNEATPVEGSITWVNTTSFTVLNSAVDVSQFWTSGTGGEVEILQGTGSGSCVHITNAVNNAGTWTVTIDEVVTGVTTGTAKARFQKWIKMNPAKPLDQINSFSEMMIGGDAQTPVTSNTRCQIKCCMTFQGDDEFMKFTLVSNEDIKATE